MYGPETICLYTQFSTYTSAVFRYNVGTGDGKNCKGKNETSNNLSHSAKDRGCGLRTRFNFTGYASLYIYTNIYIALITYWHSTSSKIDDKKGVKYIKHFYVMLCYTNFMKKEKKISAISIHKNLWTLKIKINRPHQVIGF